MYLLRNITLLAEFKEVTIKLRNYSCQVIICLICITFSHLCFRSFGKLSVSADQKWTAVVRHCQEQLGMSSGIDITTAKVSKSCTSFKKKLV